MERRINTSLSNDLLLQILENQQTQTEVLHEMKGDITVRVKKLESAADRNWWATYVATPIVMLAHGLAAHFGVKI